MNNFERNTSHPLRPMPAVLAAVLLCLVALPLSAQQEPASILLTSAAASAGGATQIEVRLEDSRSRIAALTFVIEYDRTKLAFDPSHDGSSSVTFDLPSGFVAHTFPFPEEGRLGISIFDPDAPVSVLRDGLLARVRFKFVPNAVGTASVRLGRSFDASDRNAEAVPLAGPADPVGVTLPLSGAGGIDASGHQVRPRRADTARRAGPREVREPELFASKRLLPAVIRNTDADGRRWSTSLSMTNPSKSDVTTRLTMLQGSSVRLSTEIRLAPGEIRTLHDVVSTLAPGSSPRESMSGAIIIESTSPRVRVTGGLHELVPDAGTTSHSLPVIEWKSLIHTSQRRTLIAGIVRGDEPLALSLVNAGEVATTVMVEVRTSGGQTISRQPYTLLPRGVVEGIDLRPAAAVHPGETLLIELISDDADAHFFGYLLWNDRGTGAPLVQIPR